MVLGPPSDGDSDRDRVTVEAHGAPTSRSNLMKSLTILAAAGVLVATPAIGAWAAFASTDDNPSRDTSNVRTDDRTGGARHGEPEPGDDHGRHHGRHHRHGADDGAAHQRHGADDPAGHVRHSGEPEPGDDHGGRHGGRHGEAEPGDDHGGGDDGGHHG
jgi:hypothetical protein